MRRCTALVLSTLVIAAAGCAEFRATPAAEAPAKPPAATYPDLRDSVDTALQAELLAALQTELPGLVARLGATGKASLVVVDITDPQAPRVAEFDGGQMLYAASLPKIVILYAAFVEVDRGALVLDAPLRDQLTSMIRNSSNEAATAVYQRIGPARIAEIVQSEPHRLYDPDRGGGLWVGRGYGGEPWRRDPVNNISHGASAMQVARFYYLLVTERLVSPGSTAAMLEILGEPAIGHKFVRGLADANPDARIFRKSGTWKQFHADGAIVVDPGYSYIAVAIVEDDEGGAYLEAFIRSVDRVIARRQAE